MRSFLVLLLAASACSAGGPTTPPPGASTSAPSVVREAAPLAPGLYFATAPELLEHGVFTDKVNFADLRDLFIRLRVPRMPQLATATFTFTNPKGEVFYETSSPFSTDGTMHEMNVPGVMHPLSVSHAKQTAGGYSLDHAVPIAGSVLMRYPMEGAWVVMGKVDGQIYTAELQVRVAR